jgi:hypothetical protein
VRIDTLSRTKPPPSLGETCGFNDAEAAWEKCSVPCGSEGSVLWKFLEYKVSSSITRGHYQIWGDLRDFGHKELPQVAAWLKKISGQFEPDFSIRQAVLQVDVGDYSLVTYSFLEDGTWLESIADVATPPIPSRL